MAWRRSIKVASLAGVAAAGGAVLLWLRAARPATYGELASASVLEVDSSRAGLTVERVLLETTRRRRISCVLRRPADSEGTPALVLAGGFRTGARAPTLVDPHWPGAVLGCDYPWDDPSRLPALRFLWRLPWIRSEIVATPEALRLAADYLDRRAGGRRTCVAAAGASLGVFPVTAWAARDPRPMAVALLYGGAPLSEVLVANLRRRFQRESARRFVGWLLAAALRPLDPARAVGSIAPRPVLVAGARGDERIPARLTDTLFLRAGEPKRLIWMEGAHMTADDERLLRALGDSVAEWLEASLPACTAADRRRNIAGDR